MPPADPVRRAIEQALTSAQAAAELGITERRLRFIAADRGVGIRIGGVWLFTPRDMNSLRDRKPGRPPRRRRAKPAHPEGE